MEPTSLLTLSRSTQTEGDLADSHNKKSVYEKVDNPIRYKLIQMVSLYKKRQYLICLFESRVFIKLSCRRLMCH